MNDLHRIASVLGGVCQTLLICASAAGVVATAAPASFDPYRVLSKDPPDPYRHSDKPVIGPSPVPVVEQVPGRA